MIIKKNLNLTYRYEYQPNLTVLGDLKSQNFTLTAFSVFTNSKRLTTLSKDPGPLACIHGIRVLSISWIILGHRYTDNGTFPIENVLEVFAVRT